MSRRLWYSFVCGGYSTAQQYSDLQNTIMYSYSYRPPPLMTWPTFQRAHTLRGCEYIINSYQILRVRIRHWERRSFAFRLGSAKRLHLRGGNGPGVINFSREELSSEIGWLIRHRLSNSVCRRPTARKRFCYFNDPFI